MARGNHTSPAETPSLPKVEFEIIHDDKLKLPGGVHGLQERSFGYNDYSDFHRPDHYIRHIEPLESDLAKTVEYDMDEQDQEWLDMVNVDRKKGQVDAVSAESFEIIMDRLEKEWFDMTKNIPKPDFAMPSEDSTCAICDDSEGENSNAIVFCDGCNLAVHQDCYGVPYIPEGQWLCRKCTVSPENPVSCAFCPNEGGAFKQTVHGEWVHLLCAIWIPETRVANEVFMEPVTGVEKISKQRWKLRCNVCGLKAGACIQCIKPSCFVAFHATCARKEKLLMPMKSAHGAEPASLTCFCDRHLPPEQQEVRAAAIKDEEKDERTNTNTKSARAYAKTYKPGPPLVPAIIVSRIFEYINKIKIRKKKEFIQQLCRYWSLKREARRGAPLLKRLHLEPWTATAGAKVLTEGEKLMRLDQLRRLRQDLVNVRKLTDLCRQREMRKYRQMEVIYEVLSIGLFPSHIALRNAFDKISLMDKNDRFKYPVSKNDVPDYYDIVKKPICWSDIDAKLDRHEYWNLKEFRDDMERVLDNAILYNKSGTIFHKGAVRLKKDMRPTLEALEEYKFTHDPSSWAHMEKTQPKEEEDDNADATKFFPVGDLEPPVNILKLLLSSDAIKSDLNMEVDGDPITALFKYEFALVKPPPPSPPTPPPVTSLTTTHQPRTRKPKPKRDRKAEAERARANKEAREALVAAAAASGIELPQHEKDEEREERERLRALHAALDASDGFRAPRTRGATAAAAAFEVDVSAGPSHHSESDSAGPDRSRKRSSVVPTAQQPSVPKLVTDVDPRDSFNFFNAGWILPPDQKRGGRVSVDRPTLPPPRKRQKLDHSRMSMVSTAPSDSVLLSSDPPEMKHNPDDVVDWPMNVEVPQLDIQTQQEPESSSRPVSPTDNEDINEHPLNVVTQPNGVIIIEKLDTPATRRMRRKAEKMRQKADVHEGVNGDGDGGTELPPVSVKKQSSPPPGPLTSVSQDVEMQLPLSMGEDVVEEGVGHDTAFDSDLSELSEDDSDGQEGAQEEVKEVVSPTTTSPTRKRPTKPTRPKRQKKAEPYEDGTIVWAKADSYPWWPAVVHAESDPSVPRNVLQDYRDKKAKRNVRLFIVQFYDKQSSWQNVSKDKLQLLGEDGKLDEEMLASSTKQKWKASASKQLCREAFKLAIAEMDTAAQTQGGSGQT